MTHEKFFNENVKGNEQADQQGAQPDGAEKA